jgi:hypothetical protein
MAEDDVNLEINSTPALAHHVPRASPRCLQLSPKGPYIMLIMLHYLPGG